MARREVYFSIILTDITRDGACGDRLSVTFKKVISYKIGDKYYNDQACKRASVWGGSGPLIPRSSGFNGGIVFDAPRFARAL